MPPQNSWEDCDYALLVSVVATEVQPTRLSSIHGIRKGLTSELWVAVLKRMNEELEKRGRNLGKLSETILHDRFFYRGRNCALDRAGIEKDADLKEPTVWNRLFLWADKISMSEQPRSPSLDWSTMWDESLTILRGLLRSRPNWTMASPSVFATDAEAALFFKAQGKSAPDGHWQGAYVVLEYREVGSVEARKLWILDTYDFAVEVSGKLLSRTTLGESFLACITLDKRGPAVLKRLLDGVASARFCEGIRKDAFVAEAKTNSLLLSDQKQKNERKVGLLESTTFYTTIRSVDCLTSRIRFPHCSISYSKPSLPMIRPDLSPLARRRYPASSASPVSPHHPSNYPQTRRSCPNAERSRYQMECSSPT